MNLFTAGLIIAGVAAVSIGAMLFVRRTAPAGSYFEDGDRAAGVFGVHLDRVRDPARVRRLPRLRELRHVAQRRRDRGAGRRPAVPDGPAPPRGRAQAALGGARLLRAQRRLHGVAADDARATRADLDQPLGRRDVPHAADDRAAEGLRAGGVRQVARPAVRSPDRPGSDRTHGAEGVIPAPLWIVLFLSRRDHLRLHAASSPTAASAPSSRRR